MEWCSKKYELAGFKYQILLFENHPHLEYELELNKEVYEGMLR